MAIEVVLVSQNIMKPSSPTPEHNRRHLLSSLDQIITPVFQRYIFFYPGNPNINNAERGERLKKSVTEALTVVYPLAGRLMKDNMHVDCNDEGVPLVEAKAKCSMMDVLQHRNCYDLEKLIALPFVTGDLGALIAYIQITYFDCGGMAVAFSMLHKLGDAVGVFMFLNCWTAITRGTKNFVVPRLDLAATFPPMNLSDFNPGFEIVDEKIVAKWFVFDAASISAIRDRYVDKSRSGQTRGPSRVEALTAYIWSKYFDTTQDKGSAHDKTYMVHLAVNLRTRVNPPLSQQFGNIMVEPVVAKPDLKSTDGSYGIISQMRESMRSIDAAYVKKLQNGDEHLAMMKERAEAATEGEAFGLTFTSLCGFPIYETDFGWGKPIWISLAPMPFSNLIILLDTKVGGGIEAYIHLTEEDMAKFEKDAEIAKFASPAPRVKLSAM